MTELNPYVCSQPTELNPGHAPVMDDMEQDEDTLVTTSVCSQCGLQIQAYGVQTAETPSFYGWSTVPPPVPPSDDGDDDVSAVEGA